MPFLGDEIRCRARPLQAVESPEGVLSDSEKSWAEAKDVGEPQVGEFE